MAIASRLSRQPSQAVVVKDQTKLLRTIIPVLLIAVLLCGSLLAQAPSAEQQWPQNHQDGPYSADPEPVQPYPQQTQPSPEQAQPYADQQQPYADAAPTTRQPLDAGPLEQLVAPIALYPDALVAQVLAASTYPQQVADADRWRQSQGYATPDEIASAADAQQWDPSVKALTAFPQVLAQMDRNLQWTADLGNAYFNQPQDVLEAVQVMRRRAQAAGTLQSTPQEAVRYDEGNIVLAPPNPQVVYVPAYNPWAVYGAPVTPYPGFSLLGAIANIAGVLPLRFGAGIAMASFTQPWGWLAWGLDWLGHALLFNHSDYYSHSGTVADWGFSHRGFYAYRGRAGFGGRDFARMRGGEEWRRGGYNSGGWRGFNRGPERPVDRWNEHASQEFEANRGFGSNRGFESNRGFQANRGFESFRGEPRAYARPGERMPESRGGYPSGFGRGAEGFRRSEPYARGGPEAFGRGAAPRNEFRGRSPELFGSGKSQSGGSHLFGGGHSHDSFSSARSHNNFGGGHSGFFGGGHAPKSSGGGHGFGGGHSHGGSGGHSGGHSGGKHHH